MARGGIVAEEGVIVHIGADVTLPTSREVVDAEGKWALPGLVDPHTQSVGRPGHGTYLSEAARHAVAAYEGAER